MQTPDRKPWTRDALTQEILNAGVTPGRDLILHSSFKSVGSVEGGPNTLIDALLQAIGPRANLMVPTFTYCLPMWGIEPFDIVHSKSRTGAITEVLRKRPDAIRSFHPTHSVAVIGPDAEQIASNHLHATPLGVESPFAQMHRRKAQILMLGTYQDTDSSLHYCEVVAELAYVHVAFSPENYEIAWFFNEHGQVEYTQIHEVPGCSRGFRAVEAPLLESGVLRNVTIGRTPSQLLELDALVKGMNDLLTASPSMLLCNTITCTICPKRRAFMEKQ